MRSINLVSLSESLSAETATSCLSYNGLKIKDIEKPIITLICNKLLALGTSVASLDGFYFGYEIPQIGKEFDFLRISNDSVINLELKSRSTEEKTTEQLVKNKRYLTKLNKTLYLYTYVEDINKLYQLDDTNHIKEVSFTTLRDSIITQTDLFTEDLDDLFKPFDYLVSPFNSTDAFINDLYFLTPQQDDILSNIITLLNNSSNKIVAIEGDAGTGKSLLLYHYAKQIIKNGDNALIVHVAQLNSGHHRLMQEHGFSISVIHEFMNFIDSSVLKNFDAILFDEAQRLKTNQIKKIIDYVKTNHINCIFCYDKKQKLSKEEQSSESVQIIRTNADNLYKLGKRIRTNLALVSFIDTLFNLHIPYTGNSKNISLVYFGAQKHAIEYINNDKSFSFIGYTPSRYYNYETIDALTTIKTSVGVAHEVIGQEFDKVSVLIDETFYYDENGKLQSLGYENIPYDFIGMLHQAVTRARKEIKIVIVNNPGVYNGIASFLTK